MKVLVSDSLSPQGVKILQETPGIEVDVNTGLTPEELKGIIGQYHGLIIRSATRVTAEIIEAAHHLKVIGRAGIGLDNVDVPAASKRGIVVMNTPEGNIITAAEHAMAMMMAMSRNIPQGTASLKAGKWEKENLEGRELFNKTLGLIGAGHIGRIVAQRARGTQTARDWAALLQVPSPPWIRMPRVARGGAPERTRMIVVKKRAKASTARKRSKGRVVCGRLISGRFHPSGHVPGHLFLAGLRHPQIGHDPPIEKDQDPMAVGHDLVQVARTEQEDRKSVV